MIIKLKITNKSYSIEFNLINYKFIPISNNDFMEPIK